MGKVGFTPEAELTLVNFNERVLVSKEILLEYCVIQELFIFKGRTKSEI